MTDFASTLRRTLFAATLLALAAGPLAAEPPKKLIILGFDGADAKLTQKWMDEGKLPNLAKLRAQGTFSPLRPTIPSQTPVSWSTFSTGLNPGRHGVFDFLKRDPKTYHPAFAAAEEGKVPFLFGKNNGLFLGLIAGAVLALLVLLLLKLFRLRTVIAGIVAVVLGIAAGVGTGMAATRLLPLERPIAISNQHGDTFWKLLGQAGKKVRVMRIPVTFPPKAFEHGELLSGLGVPDLSKRIGKPFYFTSELFFTPKGGGDFSVEVTDLVDNKGSIDTEIKGPQNELFPKKDGPLEYVKIPMNLTVAPDRKSLQIKVSGNELTMKPGEWSEWVRFTFPFNSVIKVQGIGRFKLLSLDPEVRLYLSPIDFDPENLPPGFDVTTPAGFVGKLTSRHGLFKTRGWMIDTWSMQGGTIDEQTFLDDVKMTVDKEKEILDAALKDGDWDVLVHYFEFTDRVQHMMFRYFDPKHPLYTADGAAKWGGSILAAYQEMDRIVGDVMQKRPDAALMVVSDHGFASFRRGMNYNTWLVKNGFMTLTGQDAKRMNLEDLFDQGDFFVNVDWSKTKAYALGLGQIYINQAGREAKGIVQAGDEYKAVTAQIKAGLEAFVDTETGEHPVAHVFTRDEAYNGVYDPVLIPDLIPSNNEGYRVGWQDALGGVGKAIVEPNTEIWSGDHCSVYPPIVQGILFSSFKMNAPQGAYMGDVMPTILDLYGVKPTTNLDGHSLVVK
ncbi:MAG TPA: alkaline phosphatase family protein [Thermoanaerobaculia bacterium]|jgi:predicted AlkP superfamily phosphohydrolase/phosphomutase|nr:alkaline phosphatase family protein [Thermoanaerobaculia bacterium]